MGIQRLVMGFKPIEIQAEYGRLSSVMIDEIHENGLIPSEEEAVMPLIHSQTNQINQTPFLSMEKTEVGSNFASFVGVRRCMGYANGFNVTPMGRAVGLSLWWDDSI
ncbi:unnamed protein product [Malus baccata var. baccata]